MQNSMQKNRSKNIISRLPFWAFLLMLMAVILILFCSLAVGSVKIPLDEVVNILAGGTPERASWQSIVLKIRLPKALTALLVGIALSISGLQMQTLFRNPLADPFVLGINSGASLGVALVILSLGATGSLLLAGMSLLGDLGLGIAAIIGAGVVLLLVLVVGRSIKNSITLLILGLMFGYATSAVVSLLIYFSIPERIQSYTIWSFGSFGGVTWSQMMILAPGILLGLIITMCLPKTLNALLLGEDYAKSMGVNTRQARFWIILSSSILAGLVTAFCGPIGFLGVAIPHLCRTLFNTSDHRVLLPACCFFGGGLALIADMLSQLPGTQYILPINVVTSLLGAPFIIWVIMKQRKVQSTFNR